MTTKTLDAAKTLDTMIELRNENAAAAGYWLKRFGEDDSSYKTCALVATGISDVISVLFKLDEDFTIKYVETTIYGKQISYNEFRRI